MAKSSKDTPSFTYLIEKKRDGGEFTDEEIRSIVDSILDEEMPEFQQAAWLMTTFFQGMSAQEIAFFAEEMMLSGEVIEMMDVSRPKIEKYSTGGVGDKTSLVLGPLSAAAGVAMPLMNGDDEEFLTSNSEKLKAIPKVKTDIDLEDFTTQVRNLVVPLLICTRKFPLSNPSFMNYAKRLGQFHRFPLSLPVP